MCQQQGESKCLAFVLANLDAILAGADITKVNFSKKYLRAYVVRSLINKTLSFPHSRCKSRGKGTVYVMRAK